MDNLDRLNAKLRARERVFGYTVYMPDTYVLAEYMPAGVDYILFDCEHGPADIDYYSPFYRGCRRLGIPTITRVPDATYVHISHALDVGSDGIMLPRVETLAQVKTAVEGAEGGEGDQAEESTSRHSAPPPEPEEGGVAGKVLGVIGITIAAIGLVAGLLVWYVIADRNSRERAKQEQIAGNLHKAREAIADIRRNALKFAEEFDILAELVGILFAYTGIEFWVIQTIDSHALRDSLLAWGIEVEALLIKVIDTLEALADVDRPSHRTASNLELLLQFVQEVERILALAVHLVDKYDDRRIAHTADLHKLIGLALHTLGAVDHDDDRIDSRERTEGIFLEVLVTRSIEDVDLIILALQVIVK